MECCRKRNSACRATSTRPTHIYMLEWGGVAALPTISPTPPPVRGAHTPAWSSPPLCPPARGGSPRNVNHHLAQRVVACVQLESRPDAVRGKGKRPRRIDHHL